LPAAGASAIPYTSITGTITIETTTGTMSTNATTTTADESILSLALMASVWRSGFGARSPHR